jgi:multidrug transporter EmrE-like cation transporter
MNIPPTGHPEPRKVRVWPGIVAVVLLFTFRFGVKALVPGIQGFGYAVMGSLVFALVVIVWWAFFSRSAWAERLAGLALIAAALGVAWLLKHDSMSAAVVVRLRGSRIVPCLRYLGSCYTKSSRSSSARNDGGDSRSRMRCMAAAEAGWHQRRSQRRVRLALGRKSGRTTPRSSFKRTSSNDSARSSAFRDARQ